MRQTHTNMDNVSENVRNEKRTEKKDVTLSEGWTWDYEIPDLTYENSLLDTNGLVEGPPKSQKNYPSRQYLAQSLKRVCPRNISKKETEDWETKKKTLICEQHAATEGIDEVEAYDKDVLKMIADARLKLEKVNALDDALCNKRKNSHRRRSGRRESRWRPNISS